MKSKYAHPFCFLKVLEELVAGGEELDADGEDDMGGLEYAWTMKF